MSWFTKHKKKETVLALAMDQTQLNLLVLDNQQNISYATTQILPPHIIKEHEIQDILALSQVIKAHVPAFEKKVIMAIDTAMTIYQYINFDTTLTQDEQFAKILLNIQQAVPYALNEIALDYQSLDPTKSQAFLWVCAREIEIKKLRQTAKMAGLKPIFIDVEAFAIARASMYGLSFMGINHYQTFAIIDINSYRCLFITINHERVLLTYEEKITLPLINNKLPSEYNTDHAYLASIKTYTDKLMIIIKRSIHFFENKHNSLALNMLALSGPFVLLEQLKQQVNITTGLTCHVINPFLGMKINNNVTTNFYHETTSWTLVLGLALRGFLHAQH